MLNIEGDSISAVDVAFHLEELRGNIALRKEERYCGPQLEAEKQILMASNEYDESEFDTVSNDFYGNRSFVLLELEYLNFIILFRFLKMLQTIILMTGLDNSMNSKSFHGSHYD